MNIKVIMTTYNRTNLLQQCVDSIVESNYYPEGIEVFDDCSTGILLSHFFAIHKLKGVKFHENEQHLGCNANTPHALETVFAEHDDCTHIVVVDSDLLVVSDWWERADACVQLMTDDKNIAAIQLLNLDNIVDKTASEKYPDLLECKKLSGCGLIVSREFYRDYIAGLEPTTFTAWDVRSTENARMQGKKLYTLKDSAMQHIGDEDGMHRGVGQVSSTFIQEKFKVAEKFSGQNVFVITGENFCDMAVSLMAAHIITGNGYRPIITNMSAGWGEFVSGVTDKEVTFDERHFTVPQKDGRYNIKAKNIAGGFGRNSAVINMEIDSDENGWVMHSCNGNVEEYITRKLAEIGIKCANNDFNWGILQCNYKIDERNYNGASVGNTTLVNNMENDKKLIMDKVERIEGLVKDIVKDRPNDVSWRKSLFNIPPFTMVKAINSAGSFVSVMNRSSFVSLFCEGKKNIYYVEGVTKIILPGGGPTNHVTARTSPRPRRYYSRLNLMFPTYGRAKTRLPLFIKSALQNVATTRNICFTFCVNEKDTDSVECIKELVSEEQRDIIIENLPAPHLGNYFNMMYDKTRFNEKSTLVSMLGDDMVFMTKGYDEKILSKANDMNGRCVLYCDDDYLQRERLCVNLFTTRLVVEAIGGKFMCDYFPIEFIDNVWMQIGQRLGILKYMPDVVIRHEHSNRRGPESNDDTYRRMRKQEKDISQGLAKMQDYIDACVNAAKGKL